MLYSLGNMKSFCLTCIKDTNQEIINDYIEKHYNEFDNYSFNYRYQIIKCRGCDTVSFRVLFSDMYSEHTYETENIDPWKIDRLYPKGNRDMILEKKQVTLPPKLRSIYKETIDAYNNSYLLLCSAGIRSIIEGICADNEVKENLKDKAKNKNYYRNLRNKINGLADIGFLTERNAEILQHLRFIGNDALHKLERPSKKELKIALDIVDIIIKSTYELKLKGEKLIQNTQERMNKE